MPFNGTQAQAKNADREYSGSPEIKAENVI